MDVFVQIIEFIQQKSVKINYGCNEIILDVLFYDAFYGAKFSNFQQKICVAVNGHLMKIQLGIFHLKMNHIPSLSC